MRIVSRALIGLAVLGTMVAGCTRKQPTTSSANTAKTTAPTAPAAQAEPQDDPAPKKPRFREATVYVDGEQVGVLRPLELPPQVKSRTVSLGGGYEATRWAFTDYARSLGIDVKKIRALHLYGGSRVVAVDAAELAREGDGLRFGFLQGDRGKPQVVFPPTKLHVSSTIDLLSGVAFYVNKEPPRLVDGALVMPDGSRVADGKMPYAAGDSGKGTRLYVDGKLVGAVKRRKLTDDLVVSKQGDAEARFSLAAFESKLGVDVRRAKSVDLLAGDDVIARMPAAEVAKTTFTAPRNSHGKIVVDLPGERAAKVSAVQVYVNTKPPSRVVASLDDVPEASPSSGAAHAGPDDDEM